jgi:hypothetical protein
LEIIADNLSKSGWSWGCVSAIDSNGKTIFVADAHRDDGKRFVVRADEKLTAFLELEIATSGQREGFLGKGVFRAWGRTYDLKSLGQIFLNNQGSAPIEQTVADHVRSPSVTSSDSFSLSSARLNKPQGPDLC